MIYIILYNCIVKFKNIKHIASNFTIRNKVGIIKFKNRKVTSTIIKSMYQCTSSVESICYFKKETKIVKKIIFILIIILIFFLFWKINNKIYTVYSEKKELQNFKFEFDNKALNTELITTEQQMTHDKNTKNIPFEKIKVGNISSSKLSIKKSFNEDLL